MTHAFSPISTLPHDVLKYLFQTCDFHTQVIISLVCKRWNRFISEFSFEYGQICGLRRLQRASSNNIPLHFTSERLCGVSGNVGLVLRKPQLQLWNLATREREVVRTPHPVLNAHWVAHNRFLSIAQDRSEPRTFHFTLWETGSKITQVAEEGFSTKLRWKSSGGGPGGVFANFKMGRRRRSCYIARVQRNTLVVYKDFAGFTSWSEALEHPKMFECFSDCVVASQTTIPRSKNGFSFDWIADPATLWMNKIYSLDAKSAHGWLVTAARGDTDEGVWHRSKNRIILEVFSSQTGKSTFVLKEWQHTHYATFTPFPFWICHNFLIVLLEGTLCVYHIPTKTLVASMAAHDSFLSRGAKKNYPIQDVQIDKHGVRVIFEGKDHLEIKTFPWGASPPSPIIRIVQPGFSMEMKIVGIWNRFIIFTAMCCFFLRSKFFTSH